MNAGGIDSRPKKYAAIKTRIFVCDIILTLISLVIFQIFVSRFVSITAFNIHTNFYVTCLIFTSIFLVFMYVIGLPLHFISSFLIEHRFNLSNQTFKAWLQDEIKSVVLSYCLAIIGIEIFYLILRNFSVMWWLIFAVIWILFSIVMAGALPTLLIPLFYKYLPIEDKPLKESIIMLAEKTGIQLLDVCKIDFSRKTSKANAALVGLGKTRKVILADTLTDNFTQKEIESVVAHEFGHFKYKHTWQLLTFSGIVTISSFFILSLAAEKIVLFTGASALSDIFLLPTLMLLMFIFGLILLPIQNFFSRVLERQADKFALDVTDNPEDFISVMQKLADVNLADVSPSMIKKFFLYNHPPINERIEMGRKYMV